MLNQSLLPRIVEHDDNCMLVKTLILSAKACIKMAKLSDKFDLKEKSDDEEMKTYEDLDTKKQYALY
jgi:hypothetical protein